MKIFKLEKKAYHSLENCHHITISESGHLVARHDSRVRYYIVLDEQIEKWIYFRFTKVRDECREFILEKKSARCMVQADFDQVSKFNV